MTTDTNDGAMSIDAFCKTYSVGRTKTYAEIAGGRLKAHKLGMKTLILKRDAEAWINALPELRAA